MPQRQQTKEDNARSAGRTHRNDSPIADPVQGPFMELGVESVDRISGLSASGQAELLFGAGSDEHRADLMLHLQRSHGNAYVQRLLSSKAVHAKLTVSQPGDASEREADTVAGLVMQEANSSVQRQEVPEEEEELQMMSSGDIETRIESARGRGQLLSRSARADLEPHFGHDFGEVRVHTDAEADSLNRQLDAEAFTSGSDIFFKQGNYRPESESGLRLLAHELTHVVQQSAAPMIQRNDVESTTTAEAPATTAAAEGPTPEQATTPPATVDPARAALRAVWDAMVIGKLREAHTILTSGGTANARATAALPCFSVIGDTIDAIKMNYRDDSELFGRMMWLKSRAEIMSVGLRAFRANRYSMEELAALIDADSEDSFIPNFVVVRDML